MKKECQGGIANAMLADVAGKVFKVADVKQLEKEVATGEISYSRMVEKMNERVKDWYSGQPLRPLAKMDVVRYLEAYKRTIPMSEELTESLNQTLCLIKKQIVGDCEAILFGLGRSSNFR